jgi:heat shock protein HtpX
MTIASAKYYRRLNTLHSLLLLITMLGLLALVGWLFAGFEGVIWAIVMALIIIISARSFSPGYILSLYHARLIYPDQAPQLYNMLYKLSNKAGIKHLPVLYYLPSQVLNAFTIGLKKDTCIVINDGLLRKLNYRELEAVLAHEISHIHNNDLWVMLIADILSRLTSILALCGYLIILFFLPFMLFYQQLIPWLLLIILVLAPNFSALLQLALSRTREYNADLVAAQLTGDPLGLATALKKIEYYQHNWIERLFLPGHKVPDPSLLRSHPSTQSRIDRLEEIAKDFAQYQENQEVNIFSNWPESAPIHKPKRRISGLWY